MSDKTDDVELIFSPPPERMGGIRQAGFGDIKQFTTKITDIQKWFNNYHIESIELWLEGGIETSGVTKLFVSLDGKGGCKITLKPKNPT